MGISKSEPRKHAQARPQWRKKGEALLTTAACTKALCQNEYVHPGGTKDRMAGPRGRRGWWSALALGVDRADPGEPPRPWGSPAANPRTIGHPFRV